SVPAAVPPHFDDDCSCDAGGRAAGARHWYRIGNAPTPRLRHGWRAHPQPTVDPVYDPGCLSLPRSPAKLASWRQKTDQDDRKFAPTDRSRIMNLLLRQKQATPVRATVKGIIHLPLNMPRSKPSLRVRTNPNGEGLSSFHDAKRR